MLKIFKYIASIFSSNIQQELKRYYYKRQIKKGKFITTEKEYSKLNTWIGEGDNVLDIGANIGHYTIRLSEIVGVTGRVFAFEPVPQTFEMLSSNVGQLPINNTTLFNVAASDSTDILQMTLPIYNDINLKNYYTAHLTDKDGELSVLSMPIDCLKIPQRIKLAKIDVEGHELSVLKGMKELLSRDHPVLIVEGQSENVQSFLESYNYTSEDILGSHNRIFK